MIMIKSLFILVCAFACSLSGYGNRLTILIKMLPDQEEWFLLNAVRPFERLANVTIYVDHFTDYTMLQDKLKANPSIDVIKVPMDFASTLADEGLIAPISDIADPAALSRMRDDFILPPLASRGKKLLYVPRKFETRIMVYRISKVAEAVAAYQAYKTGLDSLLRKFDNTGLPGNYALESDPNEWDYFDVLMAGYTWARTSPGPNPGKIGQRGKNYPGTFLGIADRAFQFGATRSDIPSVSSNAVTESFEWEHLFARLKVCNTRMYSEEWSGKELWMAFGDSSIYLSFLTQLDCFFMLGTGENGLKGYFHDDADIDFAIMPSAAPLGGRKELLLNRNITTNGWFWGIGKEAKHKEEALKLIMFMTSQDKQKREFEAFGALPTRKALLAETDDRFYMKKWINRMLQISARQISINRLTLLPTLENMEELQNRYYAIIKELCFYPEKIKTIENVDKIILRYETKKPRQY